MPSNKNSQMIEIEKKFILVKDDVDKIKALAEPLGETIFSDTYYDSSDFTLTRRDMWMRSRSGKFELKLPVNCDKNSNTNQYIEIDDKDEIAKVLDLDNADDLAVALSNKDIIPFCTIVTTRNSLKNGQIKIDIDETDFGYSLVEFEILAEEKTQIHEAEDIIRDFANELGLGMENVRGKVIEYLRINSPEHYQALIESGTVTA